MKKFTLFTVLIICVLIGTVFFSACDELGVECDELDVGQIKIMSANIRCITSADRGNRAWKYRKNLIAKNFQQVKPSIIGMQEVTPQQYEYCKKLLKNYQSEITYRDDSNKSEGCPIFYYKELYTLISKGTFWLSETPDVMSKDWGSECYRICTYVILRDNNTNKEFAVFNTHLDNVSKEARVKGISVILEKMYSLGNYPAVIMGDFNATENSQTYLNATEVLWDVKYQVDNDYVNCATYHNWGQKPNHPAIDFFLITQTGFAVDSYEVVTTTYDGEYPSDHFPIVTKLTLNDL